MFQHFIFIFMCVVIPLVVFYGNSSFFIGTQCLLFFYSGCWHFLSSVCQGSLGQKKTRHFLAHLLSQAKGPNGFTQFVLQGEGRLMNKKLDLSLQFFCICLFIYFCIFLFASEIMRLDLRYYCIFCFKHNIYWNG